MMVGGEPGARLLKAFAPTLSPDKLLACIHRLDVEAHPCPGAIGIDDFAFRRSADYGTLVLDIERGKPVELLCSREQKVSITQIAKKLGVGKNTVRYDLRADAQPQARRNTQRQSPLNAFKAFLEQRFSQGCG